MNNKYENPEARNKFFLDSKQMDLDAGWFGKILGAKSVSPINLAGVLIVLLLILGFIITFTNALSDALKYWETIGSFITLALGYVFGKSSKDL